MKKMSITKILEKFDERFYEGKRNSVYCKKHNLLATPFEIKQFIKSEIENALKEVMPKQYDVPDSPLAQYIEREKMGFNACRQQLLSNIKKYLNN